MSGGGVQFLLSMFPTFRSNSTCFLSGNSYGAHSHHNCYGQMFVVLTVSGSPQLFIVVAIFYQQSFVAACYLERLPIGWPWVRISFRFPHNLGLLRV